MTAAPGRAGPLDGVRVIDLTTVVAGPYATQMLGDLGAEVTKIEPPGGDIMRAPGPARHPGMGAAFLNCNRNKRSLSLDLRSEAGRARLREMVEGADVLVHNMRMAAARRAGLDAERLLALNPRLVHCAIVGFGQDGPYRDRPAYDDIIQAAAGWAGLSPEPAYAPTIVADKTTGLFAVSAITAALYHRAQTGEGQAVEVPMFEAMVAFLAVEHLGGLSFRPPEGPAGYDRVLSPPPAALCDGRRPCRGDALYRGALARLLPRRRAAGLGGGSAAGLRPRPGGGGGRALCPAGGTPARPDHDGLAGPAGAAADPLFGGQPHGGSAGRPASGGGGAVPAGRPSDRGRDAGRAPAPAVFPHAGGDRMPGPGPAGR